MIEPDTGHLVKYFAVFWETFRVKPIKQLLNESILVDRHPYLPVLMRLSRRLSSKVLLGDDKVFELWYCTSLTLQQADLVEELAHSVRSDDVEDVLFFA